MQIDRGRVNDHKFFGQVMSEWTEINLPLLKYFINDFLKYLAPLCTLQLSLARHNVN